MSTTCDNCEHLRRLSQPVVDGRMTYPSKCVVDKARPNLIVGIGNTKQVPRTEGGEVDAYSDMLISHPEDVTCGLFYPLD